MFTNQYINCLWPKGQRARHVFASVKKGQPNYRLQQAGRGRRGGRDGERGDATTSSMYMRGTAGVRGSEGGGGTAWEARGVAEARGIVIARSSLARVTYSTVMFMPQMPILWIQQSASPCNRFSSREPHGGTRARERLAKSQMRRAVFAGTWPNAKEG